MGCRSGCGEVGKGGGVRVWGGIAGVLEWGCRGLGGKGWGRVVVDGFETRNRCRN